MHSLFRFLDAYPLSDKQVFEQKVVKPIREKKEIGLANIRVVMAEIALRRTKNEVETTIQLVEKTVEIRKISFQEDSFHKDTHDELYDASRAAFIGLLRSGVQDVITNLYTLFKLVLRVRQACCHGGLIPAEDRVAAKRFCNDLNGVDIALLDQDEGKRLFEKLVHALTGGRKDNNWNREGEEEECAVCLENLDEETAIILRTCAHIFCREVGHSELTKVSMAFSILL